jgi:hypothetical protein
LGSAKAGNVTLNAGRCGLRSRQENKYRKSASGRVRNKSGVFRTKQTRNGKQPSNGFDTELKLVLLVVREEIPSY